MLLPNLPHETGRPAEHPTGRTSDFRSGDLPQEDDQGPLTVDAGGDDVDLSSVERQVVAFAAAFSSREESAQSLGISPQALDQHLADIFQKLRLRDEFELILFALHHHLIDP